MEQLTGDHKSKAFKKEIVHTHTHTHTSDLWSFCKNSDHNLIWLN